jgi:UDP-N-acetylmuramate dehydrogenase
VIVPDEGFPGLVLHVREGDMAFGPPGEPSGPDRDAGRRVRVRADAGVTWDDLVAEAVERELSGVECLSGIPGTVGAAPMQNVGAYGQELSDTLLRVRCLDRHSLETRTFGREECEFSYRDSRFKSRDRGRWAVLEVELALRPRVRPGLRYEQLRRTVHARLEERGEPPYPELPPDRAISLVRETVLALRRRKSMVLDPDDPNARSAGSFFLNPVLDDEELSRLVERCRVSGLSDPPTYPAEGGTKVPAAWLVERAGFRRGLRRDGVGVSENHSLALVHYGGGSTRELLDLAADIREAVARRFGVRLEREPTLLEP